MFGLFKKQKKAAHTFDRSLYEPCVRRSICTGERSVGFRDLRTGKFEEYAAVKTDEELQAFLDEYGIRPDEVRTIY